MRNSAYIRFSICLVLFVSLLSPTLILAGGKDGKKHFKLGMDAEVAEQWDKAAEQFALAVAENPKNPEYRLHYARSVFNASQMFMKRGTALANEKDYAGAYIAFRKAYGYDPVNELAKSEMERMLRLQQAVQNGENPDAVMTDANGTVKLVQTGYQKTAAPDTIVPQKLERLQDVPFPGGVDLQFLIRELSKSLDLNVLFDTDSRLEGKKIKIELKNVTAAKALDYIFLQEGLFFQKVGPRTILVANQNRRQNYQQLVLRTFYLANANPTDVSKIIVSAIPAQPGRTPTITLVDPSTNSLTVRDTEENIRLISKLINSLDKDRAEVVMDVAIYEVTKSDLLQFGTQIGDSGSLINLGGSNRASVGLAGNNGRTSGGTGANFIAQSLGLGLVIPAISFQALQEKRNTNLIASTQIHAFNNEDSSARIGQRVPVRSATISNGFGGGGQQTPGGGNSFVGDVINYEQVGLTLKFKPIVFPNQDVQVAMEIESKDVAGASTLTPTFTERTIKGTARVQNNKTLLLASVAQGVQSNGRTGLPLLGLIPILGRLFTAPTRDNRQVDIVIAITPKVIRAPAILPEDEVERPTGSLATPTSGSLEAMIIKEEIEEQLAAARRLPTVAQVQLPDQKSEAPTYTKSTAPTQTNASTDATTQNQTTAQAQSSEKPASIINNLRPIDVTAKTLQIAPTSEREENKIELRQTSLKTEAADTAKSTAPIAELQFLQNLPAMKAGERTKIAVMVRSATAFRSAVLGMKFDEKKVAVRGVSFGEVFGREMAQTSVNPFFNQAGKTFISLSSPKDTAENSSGILAYIEVEALTEGKHEMAFERDVLNFLTADGKNFSVKF
ncbi:MAG TPA: secretin N-terminal domain-containing protein [Pyrinomonadaceae bacterium]|nr:secretin N-terminal domain-containing protein [Pyrinomonadaceae bacterium]